MTVHSSTQTLQGYTDCAWRNQWWTMRSMEQMHIGRMLDGARRNVCKAFRTGTCHTVPWAS